MSTQVQGNDNFSHIVRTTDQWNDRAIVNTVIPRGCLCVELTPDKKTKIKIGEGDKFYRQLPYIDSIADLSNYYTKSEVDAIIAQLNYMDIASTDIYLSPGRLPMTGNKLGDVRFVKNKDSEINPFVYLWNGTRWIPFSTSNVDLSEYAKKSEVMPRLTLLEQKAHTHENKSVLDATTASYTIPEKSKLASLKNYTEFEGTDGTSPGKKGLVPAPAVTDADKFLSSDGSWKTVSSGGTSYQAGDGIEFDTETDPVSIEVKIGQGLSIDASGALQADGGISYSAGTNGQILRSNGTSTYWGSISNSDLTTINNTAAGPLGWTSQSQGAALPTLNTIAYWNGAYGTGSSTGSNLEYCKIGKFGSIVTKSSTDYVPNTSAGVSGALNLLTTGSSNPELNDYYISQFAGGGTTTTTYHRRPILNLWNTFRSLITTETTGSGNAVTAVSIANDGNNRKITFTKGSTFSLSDHTHNYAGSSSAGGAATSANKLNTNAGSATQPVYFSGGIPVVTTAPASGAYWSTVPPVNSSGVMEIGRYLDFHATSESTNSYDLRFDASSTSLLTLRSADGTPNFCIEGTLPRLRFKQITSGSEYDNQNAGISAYPASTGGLNLVMQSSGLTIVGGGESPKLLYDRIITTTTNPYGDTSLQTSEQTFLTSDNHIYFVSGANNLSDTAYTDWTNLKTVMFDSSGNFRPSITQKGSIGTSTYEWENGYIHNIYGLMNHTKTNPISSTVYGLTFHATANTEEPKYLRTSDGVRVQLLEGTTSAQGTGVLILGNGTASGTALNKYGVLRMYGSSTSYVQLSAGSDSNTIRFSHSSSTAGSNISPNTSVLYDLGTSSLRWREIYARTLDGNLRHALVYDNASNAASYPWHKFAETTITGANSDAIITFLLSRTAGDATKIAILSVRARTGSTKVLTPANSYIHFNYISGDAFDPNDVVAVYTDTANTSCKIDLYVKVSGQYNGVFATVLKEHNRVSAYDSWTLTRYTETASGLASVPAGTGHLTMLSTKQEVLYEKTGGFTKSAYNTVTFSKPVFGVYKLALLIIDQSQIDTNSYENAATYVLPLDYIKSLGVDAYPPYLTGTGWSTKNNTYVNIPGPESDPWDVAVTYVSNTSLQFSKNGNANMATNQATVKIIGIM